MKYNLIAFAYLALFSLGFLDNSRGPVYPEILNFFNMSKASGGLIFSLSSLSAFIISIFARKWLQVFGVLNSSRIALLCHLVSFLIMGQAPSSEFGKYFFLAGSFVFGLGLGVLGISLNLIISDSTTIYRRRQVFSGMHAMYGVASLMAPFIVSKLFLNNIHWQSYFLALTSIPALGLVHSLFLKSEARKEKENQLEVCVSKKDQFWLSMIFAAYISGEILVGSRLVIYLSEVRGIEKAEGAENLSLFFLCLLVGRVLFAIKRINIPSRTLLVLSSLCSVLLLCFGILFNPIFLGFSGLAMSYFFPCAMNLLGESYPKGLDLVVSRVMMIAGGALVVMHWFFGVLASYIGLETTFWLAPIFHLCVLYILQFKVGFLAKSKDFDNPK